jgi:hypothetical protein
MSKKVFFLGAGFSKAIAGYPLMDELSELAIDKSTHDILVSRKIIFEQDDKTNLEHLLTYLSTDFPWKTEEQKYEDRALYERVVDKIQVILAQKTKESANGICLKPDVIPLFEFMASHCSDISIITMNYDVLVERLFGYVIKGDEPSNIMTSANIYHYPMAYVGDRVLNGPSLGVADSHPCFPIIKLHGSINWYWTGISPSETIFYRACYGASRDDSKYTIGLKPYIIPPVLDKNSFYSHTMTKVLWQKAKDLLEESEEVYIIGYSFPQMDMSVRFLFESAIRNQKIYVVNKVNDECRDKLKSNYEDILGKDLDFSLCKDANVVSELGAVLRQKIN